MYPPTSNHWNNQYRAGQWQALAGVREMARYAIIAGYVRHYLAQGHILDVGCGEAILYSHLATIGNYSYTGVDFSEVALQTAASRHPGIALIAASAEDFPARVDRSFDAIIFNEVLYYVCELPTTLERYRAMLTPQGFIIVSMFYPPGKADAQLVAHTWEEVARAGWTNIDACQLANESGPSWRIAALAPPGAMPTHRFQFQA